MVDQTAAQTSTSETLSVRLPAGKVVATGVTEEDYMAEYAETFHEWVDGVVIKMSPVSLSHDALTDYLRDLLKIYLVHNDIGRTLAAPFVMRLTNAETGKPSNREPDIQVILHTTADRLTQTALIGPADICIEVVSRESTERDYGDKYAEYESGGVGEYWMIDPLRRETRFNRLNDAGLYQTIGLDESGHYETPLLPKFKLHVPTLWQTQLPNMLAIMQAVQTMLDDA